MVSVAALGRYAASITWKGIEFMDDASHPIMALFKIKETWCNKELTRLQKTHNIVANILFCASSGYEFTLRFHSPIVSPKTKLIRSGIAAATHVLKDISELDCLPERTHIDYVELVGTIVFRTFRLMQETPLYSSSHAKKFFIDRGTDGGRLVMNAKKFHRLKDILQNRIPAYLGAFKVMQSGPSERPIKIIQSVDARHQSAFEDERKREEGARRLAQVQNISELSTIPDYLITDSVLKRRICPISKRPIRYALTHVLNQNLHYERQEIIRWCTDPGERSPKPPEWPENARVDLRDVQEIPEVQQEIDDSLNYHIEYIRKEESQIAIQGDAHEAFVFARARELQIHDPEVDDGEITERILNGVPARIVSMVTVMSGSYVFQTGERKKDGRKITLIPKPRFTVSPSKIESLLPAVRALLGSNADADKKALEQACMNNLKFDVIISMDLINYRIN